MHRGKATTRLGESWSADDNRVQFTFDPAEIGEFDVLQDVSRRFIYLWVGRGFPFFSHSVMPGVKQVGGVHFSMI